MQGLNVFRLNKKIFSEESENSFSNFGTELREIRDHFFDFVIQFKAKESLLVHIFTESVILNDPLLNLLFVKEESTEPYGEID